MPQIEVDLALHVSELMENGCIFSEMGKSWIAFMSTEKGQSCANIHTEEEMSTTIMDIFSSDTQLQQRTPVISLVSTTGYTGRTANVPQHHPLQPGL